MCGIFGIISKNDVNPLPLAHIAQSNVERGNLGFGGVTYGWQNQLEIFRFTEPFNIGLIPLPRARAVLAHTRAPTGAQSDRIEEIHPFESQDVLLAHNGLILNHEAFPDWRINPGISVDSQIIAGGIQAGINRGQDIVASIKHTVERLEGQQACWLVDKRSSHVYIWRVMSPVYVAMLDGATMAFSSSRTLSGGRLLREGVIYRIDLHRIDSEEVTTFAYKNPYGNSQHSL